MWSLAGEQPMVERFGLMHHALCREGIPHQRLACITHLIAERWIAGEQDKDWIWQIRFVSLE